MREVLSVLSAGGTSREKVHAAAARIKSSWEQEELLRQMVAFPASLQLYASTAQPGCSAQLASGRPVRLQVKRCQTVSGAKVTTEWSRYATRLQGRTLRLYADEALAAVGGAESALIELKEYECTFAGATEAPLPGLREFTLVPAGVSQKSFLASFGASLSLFGAMGGMILRDETDEVYHMRADNPEEAIAWVVALTPLCAPKQVAESISQVVAAAGLEEQGLRIGVPDLHRTSESDSGASFDLEIEDNVSENDVWTVLTRLSDEALRPGTSKLLLRRLRDIHTQRPHEVVGAVP